MKVLRPKVLPEQFEIAEHFGAEQFEKEHFD